MTRYPPTMDPHEVAHRRLVRCVEATEAVKAYPAIWRFATLSDTRLWCSERMLRWNLIAYGVQY